MLRLITGLILSAVSLFVLQCASFADEPQSDALQNLDTRPPLAASWPYVGHARPPLQVSLGRSVSHLVAATAPHAQTPMTIVTVTSLNDSGPGTIREALKSGDRRIEFKLGGEIRLEKTLEVSVENVIVDGTSAPHPGITITGRPFVLSGARNVRLKNLRFRNSSDDNLRIAGACRNVLIENCSSTHGGDGAIDITHDYRTLRRPDGVTVRSCLIAATDKAMLVVSADNLTLEGNLFTNTGQRNPQLHGAQNFNLINNLVSNFTVYGVRVRAGSSGNVIGNLFPLSPLNSKRPDRTFIIDQSNAACRVYTKGNLGPANHDPNKLGTSAQPIGRLPGGVQPAGTVEETILARVGARPLDRIDSVLIQNNPSIKFRTSTTKDK